LEPLINYFLSNCATDQEKFPCLQTGIFLMQVTGSLDATPQGSFPANQHRFRERILKGAFCKGLNKGEK
ncbi:MAG: hypothetical protein R6X27_05505, partial [Candidatus Desulfacyla sp.]